MNRKRTKLDLGSRPIIVQTALFLTIVVVFFLCAEGFLLLIGFAYYPVDFGFELTDTYRVFVREGDFYKTKPRKVGVFHDQRFPVVKGKDDYRIFVLGGSAVYYFRDFYGLGEKLAHRYPHRRFEIVNIGGASYGSTRLLLQFQEILDHAPDLIIVYSGHNEFLEGYIRKKHHLSYPSLRKIDKALIRHASTYQLLSALIFSLEQAMIRWSEQRMEEQKPPLFVPDRFLLGETPLDKAEVYEYYRKNLEAIVKSCINSDVKVLLCTPVYSRFGPPDNPIDDAYEQGMEHYGAGRFAEAHEYLKRAVSTDRHPRRADEERNGIVRDLAERYRVPLLDVDAEIALISEHGMPGDNVLRDHCHVRDDKVDLIYDLFFDAIMANRLIR